MTVTSVIETENGYTINFSDGTTATITNGTNAPSISVIKDEDGLYYWALDGRIIEIDGRKIKAEGSDGITPQLRINSDTKEWEMSLDGTTWTPMGVTAEGQDGDSLFSKVEDGDTEVVFTLSDGKTTIVIPKTSTAGFAFVFPETLPRGGTNVDNYYLFAFGEERELPFTGDVATVDLMHVPQGWSAKLDPHAKTVTVTAPASGSSYYTEGILHSSPSTVQSGRRWHRHVSRQWITPTRREHSFSTKAIRRRTTGRSFTSHPTDASSTTPTGA